MSRFIKYDRVDDGLLVARDMAEYHLGDPSWADEIIKAYKNPEEAKEILEMEGFYDDE